MTLPLQIDSNFLRTLAPNDTRIVRVILRLVHSTATYRLRGKKRTYLFVMNIQAGCHVLDVPESIWNDGIPAGKYRENLSIAHDLFADSRPGNSPLIPVILRVGEDVPAEAPPADVPVLSHLRTLLSFLGAPDEVREAFSIIERGDIHLLGAHVESVVGTSSPPGGGVSDSAPVTVPVIDEPDPAADAKAERARKMREAKARKRAEASAADVAII